MTIKHILYTSTVFVYSERSPSVILAFSITLGIECLPREMLEE